MSANQIQRIGTMLKVIEAAAPVELGRTALMKLCFFLQTFRRVPLGYSFSLYSYGPFDADVLADLQTAEGLNVLSSEIDYYPGGYRYKIRTGSQAKAIVPMAAKFVEGHADHIAWVSNTFKHHTAAELELLSTIVFVSATERALGNDLVAQRVNSIKPHFSIAQIMEKINWLTAKDLLSIATISQ